MALAVPAPGRAQEEADSGNEWELGVLFGFHHLEAGNASAWAITVPEARFRQWRSTVSERAVLRGSPFMTPIR